MAKNRVAVVATSAALAGEKGLNRMFFLAELLAENGYDVDFITSDFQHWLKAHRDVEQVEKLDTKCNIVLLHEPGYTKNVDLKRMWSHFVFASHVRSYLKEKQYDLVYCDIPDNRVGAVVAEYARDCGIPFVVDVEDLWPKAMKMVFDVPVISDVVFSYFSLDAKKCYKLCSGVIGSSDTYRDDPMNYGIEVHCKETVYVGNELEKFDNGTKNNRIAKPDGEFWVTYAGTLGTSYDIATMINAADILSKRGENDIVFMILGDGPTRAELEELANNLNGKVRFMGYLQYEEMAEYLCKSDITVNSLKKNAPQSIVSKIGDYLAAGIPMINTCVDPEFWAKVEADGFGVNVEPENPEALADLILKLKNDASGSTQMGIIARKIAEEQFDRPKAFMKIVNMIDKLIAERQ